MKSWKLAVLFVELLAASAGLTSFIERIFPSVWGSVVLTLSLAGFAAVNMSFYEDVQREAADKARNKKEDR